MGKQIVKETPNAESNSKKRFDYHGFWKSLINRFFWNFLEMVLPDLYADADTNGKYDFLDTEFSDVLNTGDTEIHTSAHFADYVIKVPMKNGDEEFLILHCEIQGKGGKDLPFRMFHYQCFIFAHFKRAPVALAIITDKRPPSEASSYAHSHYGTNTVYAYNNLVVMELDDDNLLSSENPIALAFYAAKSALRAKEEIQRYNYTRTLAELLGERGWSMNDKRDLILFIERIINLKDKTLKKQYWEFRQQLDKEGKIMYEHFFKEIEEEMAEQRGKEEMATEIARDLLMRGDYSPEVISEISRLPVERVRTLGALVN